MIVFPELRYCFMASQALMHVRAEVIKFRFVTVAAGYAPGADAACTVENPIPL